VASPVCAAALLSVVLTTGCGGGSESRAAPNDPPATATFGNSFLSFTHSESWKAYSKGNTTSCGFPVGQPKPGGVLATWNASGPPATGLGAGTRTQVGGRVARRVDTAGGICRSIGADRTTHVLIQTRPFPSSLTEFTACLRGPGLAQAEQSVDALLASTKFRSQQ